MGNLNIREKQSRIACGVEEGIIKITHYLDADWNYFNNFLNLVLIAHRKWLADSSAIVQLVDKNNFILGLPRTWKGKDSIFVVFDKVPNMVHFIPCNKVDDIRFITNVFFKEVILQICSRILSIKGRLWAHDSSRALRTFQGESQGI